MASDTHWIIVDAVLRGIMLPLAIAIWVTTCFLARRRNDPARVAFSYLKAIFPFIILWVIFFVAVDVIAIVRITLEQSYSIDYTTDNLLSNIIDRFDFVGDLSEEIADILTIICLVELGNGFLFCLEQSRTKFQIMLRFVAIAVGVITFVLSIAWFGLWNAQFTNYFNFLNSSDNSFDDNTTFDFSSFNHEIAIGYDLDITGDAILLAAALSSVFYAGYVLHQCQSAPILKNSAVLFVVATILNLLRRCWIIAIDSWYMNNVIRPLADYDVVDPILSVWVYLVLLVLIFVIGQRKQGGLWSTPQPWIQHGVPQTGPIQQPQPQPMIFQGQSAWQPPLPQQPLGYAAPATLQGWQQGQALVYSPPSAVPAPTNGHVHEVK